MYFVCTQFKCKTVLFDSLIGPYQVLPLPVRVHQGAMEMKGYSAFPTAPVLLELIIRLFFIVKSRTLFGGGLALNYVVGVFYSPADWDGRHWNSNSLNTRPQSGALTITLQGLLLPNVGYLIRIEFTTVCICPAPPPQAKCDTRSISKLSTVIFPSRRLVTCNTTHVYRTCQDKQVFWLLWSL